MTLPRGFNPNEKVGSGTGKSGPGTSGASREEIERMIGRRVENMRGIFILGFIMCWAATAGGVYVGVTVYPWAYPLPSGFFALVGLTVLEALGLIFILKLTGEKMPTK